MTDWENLVSPGPDFRARTAVVVRVSSSLRTGVFLLGLVAAAIAIATLGSGYEYHPLSAGLFAAGPAEGESAGGPTLRALRTRAFKLERRLARTAPRGTHIVIDQTQNRLWVKRGGEALLEAVCSAGSGMVLREGADGRQWIFDTPRGRFSVLMKIENPVWKKPDWAFLEEGKPIPSDPSERFEYGTLGEYALYFGDGYMIHGTLYERLLGRSVTHGCIRLGKEDLRRVWRAAVVGTPIFIY